MSRTSARSEIDVERAPRDPDPEVPAKARRRRFSAVYRLRIVKQADACQKAGDVGALLRREGLYSSLLTNWRRQRDQGALVSMRARKRGPTGRPIDPRVKQLEAENARLQRKLQRADTIITLQKKTIGLGECRATWWTRNSLCVYCRSTPGGVAVYF